MVSFMHSPEWCCKAQPILFVLILYSMAYPPPPQKSTYRPNDPDSEFQ